MPNKLETKVIHALHELKAQNVVDIPITKLSSFADNLIIASGTSSTHVKALADTVVKAVKSLGLKPLSVEGYETGEWVLVDLGDIVVNIMQPRIRDFYHLEGLWGAHNESRAVCDWQ